MKVNGVSANSEEGCKTIRIKDVLEAMEHNRDLVIGVIFRDNTGAQMKLLEPEFDNSHIKDMNKKEKETISLDACLKAFSREELLSGSD